MDILMAKSFVRDGVGRSLSGLSVTVFQGRMVDATEERPYGSIVSALPNQSQLSYFHLHSNALEAFVFVVVPRQMYGLSLFFLVYRKRLA